MGKFHIGKTDQPYSETLVMEKFIIPQGDDVKKLSLIPMSEPQIIYIDRPVEVVVEKEIIKEVIVEKEVPKLMVEYKTVEIPVMYETIKEVPIYIDREIIKEVTPKVIDISSHLEIKKKNKTIKQLKIGLFCSIILSLIIMVVK